MRTIAAKRRSKEGDKLVLSFVATTGTSCRIKLRKLRVHYVACVTLHADKSGARYVIQVKYFLNIQHYNNVA